MQGDTLCYYPYLTARGPGELAATLFSGAGEALRWQVSRIKAGDCGSRPQIITFASAASQAQRVVPSSQNGDRRAADQRRDAP